MIPIKFKTTVPEQSVKALKLIADKENGMLVGVLNTTDSKDGSLEITVFPTMEALKRVSDMEWKDFWQALE